MRHVWTRPVCGVALVAALFVMFVSIGGGAARQAATAERELEQLEQRLVAAIGAKDLATYDQLIADDYVAVTAAGTERTKTDVMAGYRAGKEGYNDLTIGEVKAHVFGDTGIVSARTFGTVTDASGKTTPNRVRYLRVFARRQGQWKAVTHMSTPLPAEQR